MKIIIPKLIKEIKVALLEWSEKLSVKVEEIDSQHKKLIKIINNLNDAWKNDFKFEEFKNVFLDLIDYTEYHFRSEEKYMEKYNYPKLEIHRKQHRAFVDRLMKLKEKCSYNKKEAYTDLLSFLSNWIVVHIMNSDREYVPYISEASKEKMEA
ncbi:bacteriohemerythrin [bacterium BMS3Abin04]|nr:bacteriohemerythrin [bacterium BMS3Abin04]